MKRKAKTNARDEMRPDFSKGVRGKYFERYQSGRVNVVVKSTGSLHQDPEKPDALRRARVRSLEQKQRDGYVRKPVRCGEFDA